MTDSDVPAGDAPGQVWAHPQLGEAVKAELAELVAELRREYEIREVPQ